MRLRSPAVASVRTVAVAIVYYEGALAGYGHVCPRCGDAGPPNEHCQTERDDLAHGILLDAITSDTPCGQYTGRLLMVKWSRQHDGEM